MSAHGRHFVLFLVASSACACAGAAPAAPPPAPTSRADATSVVKLGGDAFDAEDRDGDGIGDAYDLCPAQAEDGKGAHPWDGCPDDRDPVKRITPWGPSPKQAVRVTRGQIKISEEILFGSGSASIDPASQPLLKSIAQILKDVPEIEIVEIAGHADSSGSDERNRKLTEQRAAAVMADLTRKQIAPARLRAAGYSAYCALDPGTDDAARAKNRRVELRILRRDGQDLEPRWGGCQGAEKHGMSPRPLPPLAPKLPADDRQRARECSEGEARPCGVRCDHGDVAACEALANLYAADEPKRALAAAVKACDLGALHFCARVAGYLREGKGAAKDLGRAHDLVVKACGKGNGRACTDAGLDHHLGNAVTRDDGKAAELYQRGCEQGDGGGCALLGAAFWSGQGVPKDRRHGLEATIAGCELGDARACGAIGASFKEEPAALRSRGRALAALHVACEQDDSAPACEAQGALAEQPGEYVAVPVCGAGDFKACRDACSKDKASAPCVELGVALLYGTGVRRRSADAAALFGEACRAGSARGCSMSALVHAGNHEDLRSERLAASDFEKACAMGEASGCVNRALMDIEGLGTYRDEETGAKALDTACAPGTPATGGVGLACAQLSVLTKKGVGVPADATRARTLLEQACAKGFRPACAVAPR